MYPFKVIAYIILFIKNVPMQKIIHLSIVMIVLLNGASHLKAQEIPCATEFDKTYADEMRTSMPDFEIFKQSFQKNVSATSRISNLLKKNSIPVKIHIVRNNSGLTSLDTALLRKGLRFINKAFEESGLEFYVCGAYNYINNSVYYDIDNTEYELLNTTFGTANVINIFMVNSITHNGASATGVAPTPGGSSWVMLRNNADTTVYPHEMGHFFGLLHTHGYSNTVRSDEYVDGSNCQEAGDYICDTPADPRLSPAIVNGANVNAQCQYFGGLRDAHYDTYVPDATNLMSYAPARCLTHFSNDQLAYMNWVYINRRSYLTCSSINVNFNTTTVMSCDSPFVYSFQKQTTGVTNLQWDVNDDNITDYTSNNPTHTYSSSGVKWVSLSGVNAGITYMRYKPIEFIVPHKVPKLLDFNSSLILPNGWKYYNPDNARSWDITKVIGIDGQNSNALRFRNFNYNGYEEEDAVVTNSFDLRNFKNARLTFDIAYAPHNVTDTFLVYLSTDCGNTYPYQILKLAGSALQTHAKQFHEFIPGENDWKNVLISLNTYVNNFVSFKIVNYNMGGNNLYIDNIRVEGGDSTLSEIGFGRTLINTSENNSGGQTGCKGYRIISVPVFISSAPTSNITVNVSTSGSAANSYDYELMNNQVVFLSGQTSDKLVNVKIYDDAASEALENITLSLTIQGSTVYRTTGKNKTAVINIADNDPINPEQKVFSTVFINENFNALTSNEPPGWTVTYINYPVYTVWMSTSFSIGTWLYNPDNITSLVSIDSTHYMTVPTFYFGTPDASTYLTTPSMNVSEYDSITIEFDHFLRSYLPFTGDIVVEVWNGISWENKYLHTRLQGSIGNTCLPEHINISAVGYTNSDFKVRFGVVNEDNGIYYLLDNVKITGFKTKARVATTLNSTATAYLGPNELVHFYDNNTGNIIASIQNQSSWNYGCTTVRIDRSGNSAVPYMDASPVYHATQKTLLITPEFNNPNGNYDISLYFKNAEINGWINATTNSLINLGIVKSGGAIANITPSNPNANGITNYAATNVTSQAYLTNDYKISGRFTKGFSGFAGANTSANNTLPIELLSPLQAVYVKDIGNEISWTTAQEFNCNYFEVQHSLDGSAFNTIAIINGQGNSTIQHDYIYTDEKFAIAKNYYRFKQVDFNGKFTYSNMAMVNNEEHKINSFELFPNPVKDILIISSNDKNQQKDIRIVNAFGQKMKTVVIENNMQNSIDVSTLSNGTYFVIITTNDNVETKAFVKQ